MKKLLLLSLLVFPLMSAGIKTEKYPKSTGTVYVCMGPKSKVYHSDPECKGLDRFSTSVKAISLKKAEEMGRRACKICY